MKTFMMKSSAQRAAKKEFGENYAEIVTFSQDADGAWFYEMATKAELAEGINKEVAVIEQLQAADDESARKAAKAKELKAKAPKHMPKAPVTKIVAEIPAPTPEPESSPELEIEPPSEEEVPEDENRGLVDDGSETDTFMIPDGDKLANAQAANVNPLKPRFSTVQLPTKKVWAVADEMRDAAKKANQAIPTRSEVIAECVNRGIAYGTARTQYQHWFKTLNDSASAPIAIIGKDGKITIPGRE